MSLNNFLCTPFVEVLTFAILWIGHRLNQNRLRFAESRAILSRVHLMLRPCILMTRALYLTSVEKVSEKYLHLQKTEDCRP